MTGMADPRDHKGKAPCNSGPRHLWVSAGHLADNGNITEVEEEGQVTVGELPPSFMTGQHIHVDGGFVRARAARSR
jgi:hypothetical protein